MRWVLVLIVVLSAFGSIGFAQSQFGCQTEFCLLNITSNLWTCEYIGCVTFPNLTVINQTNITVVNQSVINVTNYTIELTTLSCDNTTLIQSFDNKTDDLIDFIDLQFNATGKLVECEASRQTLQTEISACSDKVQDFTDNYIRKSDSLNSLNLCRSNLTATNKDLEKARGDTNNFMLGALLIGLGVGWYLWKRKIPELGGNITQQTGESGADYRKIDADAKRVQDELNNYKNHVSEGSTGFMPKKRKGKGK